MLVIEAFDKQRFITVDDEIYFMREFQRMLSTLLIRIWKGHENQNLKLTNRLCRTHGREHHLSNSKQERAHNKKQYA